MPENARSYSVTVGSQRKKITESARKRTAIIIQLLAIPEEGPMIVLVAVDDAVTITAGEALFLDVDDAKPASSEPWSADLPTTRGNFVNHFLGVALESHVAFSGARTNFPVEIGNSQRFVFACTSEAHEIGQTLGMKKAVGNALLANQIENSTPASTACFRCMVRSTVPETSVTVTLQSAYIGINQATAQ